MPADLTPVEDLSNADGLLEDLAQAGDGGAAASAAVIINEVNMRITGGQDLIELKVLQAGNLAGVTLYQDIAATSPTVTPMLLATLPDLSVQAGDLVVVHLKPSAGITAESSASGKSGCSDPTCPASAWDVLGSATQDLTDSARVVTLDSAASAIIDGLAYSNGSGPATWPAQLKALQSAGVWDPTPCPNTCAKSDADTLAIATGTSGTGVQTTVAGNSMQRIDEVVPSGKSHWVVKASTWGLEN